LNGLPEEVENPMSSRTQRGRPCSPPGSVMQSSSHPHSRAVRDGAASRCVPHSRPPIGESRQPLRGEHLSGRTRTPKFSESATRLHEHVGQRLGKHCSACGSQRLRSRRASGTQRLLTASGHPLKPTPNHSNTTESNMRLYRYATFGIILDTNDFRSRVMCR
jgi:hypothetical protein